MTKSGGGLRVGRKSRKQVTTVLPAKKQKTYTKGQVTIRRALKNTMPAGTFSRVGGNLGGIFGPAGAAFGRGAGSLLSSITGMGDYRVKSNSIATNAEVVTGEVPHFGKADNSTRVKHREFVSDIVVPVSPATFNNASYVINPSNKLLFPWLARFAENYQQYKVHGMVIYFKSTTSDYSAAGAMGKIAMATNYNVRDSDYANMQELENSEFAVSGKPSLSRLHPIECAPNNGVPVVKWIRDAQYDSGTGGDDRLYDVGKFQFATQGLPGTVGTTLGELWVTYDIEFFKPIVGRDPVAVQYTPVSLPVFDNLTGRTSGPADLYMFENTTINFPVGSTKEQVYDIMLNPQGFNRSADLNVDVSYITQSTYRANPDEDNAGWPARWYQTAATSSSRRIGRLRVTRAGLWYIKYTIKAKSNPAVIPGAATQLMLGDPEGPGQVTPAQNFADTQFMGVDFQYVDQSGAPINDDPAGTPQVLSAGASGGFTQNYKNYTSPVGVNGKVSVKRDAITWTAVLWVPERMVENNNGVEMVFRPSNGFIGVSAPPAPFTWANGSSVYDHTNVVSANFEVGLVNVKSKTYYEPVQQGLTKDDDKLLSDSVKSVMALLPKLRELGIEC